MIDDLITVDYETFGIVGNPIINPPRPVGVAVWIPGRAPQYLAWGHPTENNCQYADARQYINNIQESGRPRLYHNAPFDTTVQEQHLSIQNNFWMPGEWQKVHDTMYLLFLADPYAPDFSLKPSADRYLGMPPTEQNELRDWILKNVRGASMEKGASFWAGFIALAPGDLVGKYAVGDVVRTRKLFDLLYGQIVEKGMQSAYDRERELMPTLVAGTKTGILLDRWKLEHHEKVYTEALARTTDRVVVSLGCSYDDLGDDDRLADALERSGAVTEWVYTEKTHKRSMSKDNLKFNDNDIGNLFRYKGALETCLQTFMRPWLEKSAADGRLHPNWNQVKQARDAKRSKGAKTGRLSSDDPNFQNVPTEFTDKFGNPLPYPDGLVPLPMLREYCLPDEGFLWLKRDYSSQELRILAHFEDGSLAEAYRGNPDLDVHQMAVELIQNLVGLTFSRKEVKITGFSIIYGSGYAGLAQQLGQPVEQARIIKPAYLAVLPGVNDLLRDVKRRGEYGDSIRTWGGRIYFAEIGPDGRNFAYRLLNYLIQGSAADQTKEAICQWHRIRNWRSQFLATVHDEINIQAPASEWRMHMEDLRLAMEVDNLDVPIRSEGYVGKDWQNIVKEKDYQEAA